MTPGDGREVLTYRTDHMCFPAVPVSIPRMPNFTQLTGLDPQRIVTQTLDDICGPMIIDQTWIDMADSWSHSMGLSGAGKLAMRRLFQNPAGFVSTIRNMGQGFAAETRGDRTAHIACAFARMNSFLWMVMFLLLVALLYLLDLLAMRQHTFDDHASLLLLLLSGYNRPPTTNLSHLIGKGERVEDKGVKGVRKARGKGERERGSVCV